MIVGWAVGSAFAGFILGRWLPARTRLPEHGWSIAVGAKHDRSARLEDLVEAARARALWVEVREHGFILREQLARRPASITVHAPDPQQVLVATLQLSRTSSSALPFDLALALVDVYGPVTLVVDGEVYEVDGNRDQHALMNEMSSRMTARARDLLAGGSRAGTAGRREP